MIRKKSELYCCNIYLQANQKYFSSAAVFLTAKKNWDFIQHRDIFCNVIDTKGLKHSHNTVM